MKTISLKLPEELDQTLAYAAEEQGMSKSFMVREALTEYFAKSGDVRPGSYLDLARDLIGSMEGPPDLSVNEDYLKDLGK